MSIYSFGMLQVSIRLDIGIFSAPVDLRTRFSVPYRIEKRLCLEAGICEPNNRKEQSSKEETRMAKVSSETLLAERIK